MGENVPHLNRFQHTLGKVRLFLLLYTLFLIMAGVLLSFCSRADVNLWVNHHYGSFFDSFFKYYTYVGDGIFSLLIILILLAVEYRKALMVFLSWAVSGILVQFLKVVLFSNVARPVAYFKDIATLHLVEGVKMYASQSFPSGHSASAFALFLCLSFFSRRKYLQLIYFFLAMLVGYSRIYLSEHFLTDVMGGSAIGVMVALFFIFVFYQEERFRSLNRSLFSKSAQ